MKKGTFYTELAYVFGIIALAIGTALSERADFGMSMIVAPAYILHLKISESLPFFTFGMAEYCLQAVLLILLAVVIGRFKKMYLFSFVTAVIYGFTLDGIMWLVARIPETGIAGRVVFFIGGMLMCSLGVAFVFHTYIAPEAYELFVKEVALKYNKEMHIVKYIYDWSSCIIAIVLSFIFWGFWHFEGVKAGTLVCALLNGLIIGVMDRFLDSHFDFKDGLKFG
ncbi:MAG: hypothetical protein KBS96_06615 [Lachnospiraceae bacterium]|nr:hypothetical protein [Candidatus Colinaster scatohippi]